MEPEQGLVAGSDEVQWNELDTEAERKKENTTEATVWSNVTIKAHAVVPPCQPSFALFVDEDLAGAEEPAAPPAREKIAAPSFRSPGRGSMTEAEKIMKDPLRNFKKMEAMAKQTPKPAANAAAENDPENAPVGDKTAVKMKKEQARAMMVKPSSLTDKPKMERQMSIDGDNNLLAYSNDLLTAASGEEQCFEEARARLQMQKKMFQQQQEEEQQTGAASFAIFSDSENANPMVTTMVDATMDQTRVNDESRDNFAICDATPATALIANSNRRLAFSTESKKSAAR
jgi:hypothetical protein